MKLSLSLKMKNARDMNSPQALPLPSELSLHPQCNGGLLPWSHCWFLLCCHLRPLYMSGPMGEPAPALGVGPRGLPQPLPCPPLLAPSQGLTSSFHPFSAKQSWSIQSPTDLVPQQAPGQRALLLSLPWLPGRHSGPSSPSGCAPAAPLPSSRAC